MFFVVGRFGQLRFCCNTILYRIVFFLRCTSFAAFSLPPGTPSFTLSLVRLFGIHFPYRKTAKEKLLPGWGVWKLAGSSIPALRHEKEKNDLLFDPFVTASTRTRGCKIISSLDKYFPTNLELCLARCRFCTKSWNPPKVESQGPKMLHSVSCDVRVARRIDEQFPISWQYNFLFSHVIYSIKKSKTIANVRARRNYIHSKASARRKILYFQLYFKENNLDYSESFVNREWR